MRRLSSSSKTLIKTTKVYVMQHCLATGEAKKLLAQLLLYSLREGKNSIFCSFIAIIRCRKCGLEKWYENQHYTVYDLSKKSLIQALLVVGFQQWVIWKSKSTVWTSPPSSSILYDHHKRRGWDKLFSLFYYLHNTTVVQTRRQAQKVVYVWIKQICIWISRDVSLA